MDLRVRGKTYAEIAEALGISRATAHACVQRAIEQARRDVAKTAQERLAVADARIEWLIDRVARMIATDECFDDKKYKIVISLLERQAKMLGYDRGAKKDGYDETGDWMETAAPEKLREYAEELGLRVPSTFD